MIHTTTIPSPSWAERHRFWRRLHLHRAHTSLARARSARELNRSRDEYNRALSDAAHHRSLAADYAFLLRCQS